MENEQYINGNKRVLAASIFYLICWMLIGLAVKEYVQVRFEEIENIKDSALALKEIRSISFWTVIFPGTLFFSLKAMLLSRLGFFILKEKQWPPNKIVLPFKTKLIKGKKSKAYALSYLFASVCSVATVFLLWIGWFILSNKAFLSTG